MENVYPIPELYRSLIEMYDEAESEEEAQSILLQIKQVEPIFENIVDALTCAWQNDLLELGKWDAAIERLQGLKFHTQKRIDGLKESLKKTILSAGLEQPKVQTSIGKVRVQNNSQASVIFEGDAKDLPPFFRVVIPIQYEADKKAIADKWKEFESHLKIERPKFDKEIKLIEDSGEVRSQYEGIDKGAFPTYESYRDYWFDQSEQTWLSELEKDWKESSGFPENVRVERGKHVRLQ